MTTRLASGKRIHRFTVRGVATAVPDGAGGWTQAPTTIAENVYGEIIPATPKDIERRIAGTVEASASHLVTLPYLSGITLESTLVFHDGARDRPFTISGLSDPDERHFELVLACDEVVA